MKKKTEQKSDFLDSIVNSTAFNWLVENRRYLPYLFFGMILIILLGVKFSAGQTRKTEAEYLMAEKAFNTLKESLRSPQASENLEPALQELRFYTDNYPELRPLYDGIIAQLLLVEGREGASHFAKRMLSRNTLDDFDFTTDFTKTTLLIQNQEDETALKRATELNQIMKDDVKKYPILYAYNLLRIGMLQQKTGAYIHEMKTWKEWLRLLETPQNEGFAVVNQTIGEDNFPVKKYIESRLEQLEKEKFKR